MSEKPVWRTQQIDILVGTFESDGRTIKATETQSVDAEVWGAFAVRKTRGWRSGWAVTHVPTGRLIAEIPTKRAAQRFCAEIAPLLDWATVAPGGNTPPEISERFWEAKDRAHTLIRVAGESSS